MPLGFHSPYCRRSTACSNSVPAPASWRVKNGTAINVPKLVASPPKLDLMLLIQGSALVPYLEEGPVSDQVAWRTLMQPFGPGFLRFAIWSN